MGSGLCFGGLFHYYHGGKLGGIEVGMVLKKWLGIPCLVLQAAGKESHTEADMGI